MPPAKPPSLWIRRHDAIHSISFATDAARLNDARVKARRQEHGPTAQLRRHDVADPKRMTTILLALHKSVGANARWVVCVSKIAQLAGVSEDTVRRGIRDLEDACLVRVTRRERDQRRGGQGPSEYMIVWATVMDLALSQGLQPTLFSGAAETDSDAAAGGQPRATRGRSTTTAIAPQHTHSVGRADQPNETFGSDGPAGAGAPLHGAGAPLHGAGARPCTADPNPESGSTPACAGAPGRAHDLSSSTLNFNSHPHPPAPTVLPPRTSGGTKTTSWIEIRTRLRRMGMRDVRGCCEAAAANGWSEAQVLGLLESIESRMLGGVPPWSPGAIHWQLTRGEPGSRIEMPEAKEWQREQAAQRTAAQARRQSQESTTRREQSQQLNAEFGAALDAMTVSEVLDLFPAGDRRRQYLSADLLAGRPLSRKWRVVLLSLLSRQEQAAT